MSELGTGREEVLDVRRAFLSDLGRRAPLAATLILGILLSGSTPASAQDGGLPGDDVRVNQDNSEQPQAETAIAADPRDPLNLVATWIDFTVVNENQEPVGCAWTRDRGVTWQSSFVPVPNENFSADSCPASAKPAIARFEAQAQLSEAKNLPLSWNQRSCLHNTSCSRRPGVSLTVSTTGR